VDRKSLLARPLYLSLSSSDLKTPSGHDNFKHEERAMSEQEFNTKVAQLITQLETVPAAEREEMTKMVMDTKSRHETVSKTIVELQDAIGNLRLSIKYLVFDLEATRRENALLRKLVEQRMDDNNEEGMD
jgi:hypothetical protein